MQSPYDRAIEESKKRKQKEDVDKQKNQNDEIESLIEKRPLLDDSGTIRMIDTNKVFGFISSDNLTKDVYFKVSNVDANKKLLKGDFVTFNYSEKLKGLVATKVEKRKTITLIEKADIFIFTRNDVAKGYDIISKTYIESPWFNDPNEAKDYIKRSALNSGCNAVLSMNISRETRRHDGNRPVSSIHASGHLGTYHSCYAYIAIVGIKKKVLATQSAVTKRNDAENRKSLSEDSMVKIASKSYDEKIQQDQSEISASFVVFITLLLIYIIFGIAN
jgi:cold shock CspA family protein